MVRRQYGLLMIAVLALVGCARRPEYRSPAPIAALPQCEFSPTDTTAWRKVSVPDIGLEFRQPNVYERQNPGARHVAGKSTDTWLRNGLAHDRITVAMVEPFVADVNLSDWRDAPAFHQCSAALAAGDPPARVTVGAGEGIVEASEPPHGPYVVAAEWRFSGGRVVRLVGIGPDTASLREHLAIVRTAHFVSPPPSPRR
jgi:hypothetical protein